MNLEDVRSKIDVIQDNLDKLEILRKLSFEEFISDFRNIDSAQHRLQTSIQALLDIGGYIISSLGLKAPTSNAEIVEILVDGGLVSSEKLDSYIGMARFRNRIVHLYNDIDLSLLYRILQDEFEDIKSFYKEFLEVIKTHSD